MKVSSGNYGKPLQTSLSYKRTFFSHVFLKDICLYHWAIFITVHLLTSIMVHLASEINIICFGDTYPWPNQSFMIKGCYDITVNLLACCYILLCTRTFSYGEKKFIIFVLTCILFVHQFLTAVDRGNKGDRAGGKFEEFLNRP